MKNQVLHLADQGVTINEVHSLRELPENIPQMWFNRDDRGSPQHGSRGAIRRRSALKPG